MMEPWSSVVERRSYSCRSLANVVVTALSLNLIFTCSSSISELLGTEKTTTPASAESDRSIVFDSIPKRSLLADVLIVSDKPKSFKRTYGYFVLENGLKTLVVHDAHATESALSIAVDAGLLDSPEKLPGLAHFCEHMLFLGSEKYPESGMFRHNYPGSNAWTADEETVFHLSVSSERSEEAVDHFSDFFRAPLFSSELVDKEIDAIESEHIGNKQDPYRRIIEIFHALAHPDSPLSRFRGGNRKTLKEEAAKRGIDPIEELKKYFKGNYCPSRMRLVMHGRESIEEQRRRAEKYFGNIPRGSTECQNLRHSWAEPEPWTPSRLGKFVTIEGTSPRSGLWLQFILPRSREMWLANPLIYLAYVINYGGEGSLQQVLKDKLGLVDSISFSKQDGSYGTEVFVVASLTETQHYKVVMDIFFHYLSILQSKGVDEKLYKFLAKIHKLGWEWREPSSSVEEVGTLASMLLRYPPESVLSAGQRIDEPNVSLVSELMGFLRPDNMNIALVVPPLEKFRSDGTQVHTLPHYDARYLVSPLSTALPTEMDRWSCWLNPQVQHEVDTKCPPLNTSVVLEAPTSIEDLPDELEVTHMHAAMSTDDSRKALAVSLYGKVPTHLATNLAVGMVKDPDAFYREGWITESPKVSINFNFEVPRSENSFEGGFATDLGLSIYQELLAAEVDPKLFDLRLVGCDYNVVFSSHQASFDFDGFATCVPIMMKRVLEVFGTPVNFSDTRRYDRILEGLRKQARTYSDMPVTYALRDRSVLLEPGFASREEYLADTEMLTLDSVVISMSDLLKKPMKLTGLVMGNLGQSEAEEALNLVATIANQWEGAKANPGFNEEIRRVIPVIHPTRPVEVRRLNQRPNDPNDVIISSCLIGVATVEARVLAGLLSPKLHATAFEELRTHRQLGYIVEASISQMSNVMLVSVLVQGSKLKADEVEGAIEYVYHTAFPETLNSLTDQDFAFMVSSLSSKLLHPPVTYADEVSFFWTHILKGSDCFGLLDEMLIYLREHVTKSVLIDFWRSISYPRTKVIVKHFAEVVPPRPSKADSVKIWKDQGVSGVALARLEQEYDATVVFTNATSAERKTILAAGGLYPTDIICKRSLASQDLRASQGALSSRGSKASLGGEQVVERQGPSLIQLLLRKTTFMTLLLLALGCLLLLGFISARRHARQSALQRRRPQREPLQETELRLSGVLLSYP